MHRSYIPNCLCAASVLFIGLVCSSPFPNSNNKHGKKWCPDQSNAEMLYFMNNLEQNAIIAIAISDGGLLDSVASTTLTGGMGGNQVNSMNGEKDGPDALASQGSVQVAGDKTKYLFALNAGSSTLSVLKINSQNPSELTLLGQPTWTGGDFPNTVAVSQNLGIACVGNAGADSGVACAAFSENGLSAFDAIRPFPVGQTTPPQGPTNGISDVLFSSDESELIVMVKGNGTAAKLGGVTTFPVDAAAHSVSYQGTEVTPKSAAVLFGTATIPDTNRLLASDASFGALVLDLADLSTPVAVTNITNQKATCWAVTSPATGTGFVDDVIISQLVEIDLSNGDIVSVTNPENVGQGMIDMRAVDDKIYALSPGNGTLPAAVAVFDVSGGRGSAKAVQNFVVAGADKNAEGLAVYMSGGWGW